MVEQQISSDQGLFEPIVTNQKRSKGILKATNSPKPGVNYLLETTLPTESTQYMLTTQSEALIHEYLNEEQARVSLSWTLVLGDFFAVILWSLFSRERW